jgi:glutaryl-CoA dehydrogenase (non-decarboxylating)
MELNASQQLDQVAFKNFATAEIAPNSQVFDREQKLPTALIRKLGDHGLLGLMAPLEHGGLGKDSITFGLLNEQIGRASSAVRSLLTVHSMVLHAIVRWGSSEQKKVWLPRLSKGDLLGAFALSEPEVGSDGANVQTIAVERSGEFVLTGRKSWVSFGQIADIFLVVARHESGPTAFLVERGIEGLSILPVSNLLGERAGMLAELDLRNCRVRNSSLLCRVGYGFSHVASAALDLGRYSVAWGCVGVAQACVDASLSYVNSRKQFGKRLIDHQLVQKLITDMVTNLTAARLLCFDAGQSRDSREHQSILITAMAKYFAATALDKIANDTMQLHGAKGLSSDLPVERYLRDSRVAQIIEGSTEILQTSIAQWYNDQGIPQE